MTVHRTDFILGLGLGLGRFIVPIFVIVASLNAR